MIAESRIDTTKAWYFGNNRAKNLKLAPPKWYAPLFMTTDYKYAEDYADYGVYTITLKSEAKSKILDFSKDSEVKKLKWPKALIDDIRTGKSDLNGIAYDMYILAGHGHSQEVFDKSWYLSDAAYDFDVRSKNIFGIVPKNASWAREKDHRFVLQMWKDIHDAGFDGFTHFEFGKRILALFDFKCMDKISIKPVKQSALDEGEADADGKLKIWVDDVRPAPSGYMWVKSVNEFVSVVEHAGLESVEVVDIDHDAGDFYHDGGDYIRILDYLEFLGAKDIQVRIHSANPVGVANMRRIIRKNGWTELFDVVEEDEDTRSTSVSSIDQMFNDVIEKYYAVFGFDLTYMKFKVDSQPVYTNGKPCYEHDYDECAGDWTSLGWIRLNPDMKSVMDRYGVDGDVSQFTKTIIAHELAHEVWNNIADDQFKEEILDRARRQSFSTVYLDTVRPSKLPEETFCEYLAHKIIQHSFSSTDNQKT